MFVTGLDDLIGNIQHYARNNSKKETRGVYSYQSLISIEKVINVYMRQKCPSQGGKKAMTKLETRIRELETELDSENRRMSDAQKNLRKVQARFCLLNQKYFAEIADKLKVYIVVVED